MCLSSVKSVTSCLSFDRGSACIQEGYFKGGSAQRFEFFVSASTTVLLFYEDHFPREDLSTGL